MKDQTMHDPITIVIADDHALVVEGLRLCFGTDPEFEVVAVAENGDQLVTEDDNQLTTEH